MKSDQRSEILLSPHIPVSPFLHEIHPFSSVLQTLIFLFFFQDFHATASLSWARVILFTVRIAVVISLPFAVIV
jgi:hypothetical protein